MLLDIIFFFILLISTYIDVKKRKIPNDLMLVSFLIGTILNIFYKDYIYILFSLILFIILVMSPIKSGGDIKLLSISFLYIKENMNMFLFYLGMVSLIVFIFFKLKKEKINSIPLAPFISTAFIINLIIKLLSTL